MKQPLQKFEFATSILRFAKDRDIPMETVKEAIELLHRDICGTPSTVTAVNEEIHQCDICKKQNATLANDEDTWICEDCAQVTSDLGHEESLN